MTITDKLAGDFLHKMEAYLQEEFPAFLASYKEDRAMGYRRNPLKLSAEDFHNLSPFPVEPVPWSAEGYYLNEGDRPGKHPYYHAGLYYIQEPSAMAPVELLDVRPGDRVLDLCGAPGGKTTQIAGKLHGQGLVVANDNHPDRVKAMVKNVELFGITNAVVLNETPERLALPFAEYFDRILVDAPCSGEGMFRKEPEMAKNWSPDEVGKYTSMQIDILRSAAGMLKPGGRLVYSTCTFSAEENEATIARLLQEDPRFAVEPIALRGGLAPGHPEWLGPLRTSAGAESTRGAARLWPHKLRGEGHFVAVLTKASAADSLPRASEGPMPDLVPGAQDPAVGPGAAAGGAGAGANARHEAAAPQARQERRGKPLRQAEARATMPPRERGQGWGLGREQAQGRPAPGPRSFSAPVSKDAIVERFWREHILLPLPSTYTYYGDFVYQVPEGGVDLSGLKATRPGWFLGTIRKERFEPSQALAMGLTASQCVRAIRLPADSADAIRYLKGETLHLTEEALIRSDASVPAKGYTLVTLDGYPVGWAKWQDGMLKNEYPPGWRWT